MAYSRIEHMLEDLSNIVYGDTNKVGGAIAMQIAAMTIRNDSGLHEIFYLDSGSHDTLVHVLQSIYGGFTQKGTTWDWTPVIDAFENTTGIDFYTLISFVHLMQSTENKINGSSPELSTAVITASVLSQYISAIKR